MRRRKRAAGPRHDLIAKAERRLGGRRAFVAAVAELASSAAARRWPLRGVRCAWQPTLPFEPAVGVDPRRVREVLGPSITTAQQWSARALRARHELSRRERLDDAGQLPLDLGAEYESGAVRRLLEDLGVVLRCQRTGGPDTAHE